MVLLAFRHGLRAGDLVDLRWEQIDFATATLHVRRTKNGTPATHPLTGREMRPLRKHQRESARSAFVFVSERGAPLSAPGFSRMVERAGRSAKLGSSACSHAPPCLRLCPSECGARYARAAGVSRSRKHPEHDALHSAGAGSVQGFLAGLTRKHFLQRFLATEKYYRERPSTAIIYAIIRLVLDNQNALAHAGSTCRST